jgi:hypothetical protein
MGLVESMEDMRNIYQDLVEITEGKIPFSR